MKGLFKLFKYTIFTTFLLTTNLFATMSPFSLEGLKEVNIKVIDNSQFTNKQNLQKINESINFSLEKTDIKTSTEQFSNFIVKIQGVKIEEKYVMHISMFIIEDSIPLRDEDLKNMSITYYQEDMFVSTKSNLQIDIYDSIVNYLLSSVITLHKNQN